MVFVCYHNTFSLLLTNTMRDTFLRTLADDEKNILHIMLEEIEADIGQK